MYLTDSTSKQGVGKQAALSQNFLTVHQNFPKIQLHAILHSFLWWPNAMCMCGLETKGIGWAVWIVLKCSKASQSFLNTHERLLTSAHPAKQTQGHWSRECQWGSNTTCAETTTPIFLFKQRTDLPYNDSLLGNTQGNAYTGNSASFPFTPTSQHDHSLQTAVEICTCIVW